MVGSKTVAEIDHPSHHAVTAICIDGNSISAAAVHLDESGMPVVSRTRTLELDFLVEKVTKAAHPIFMDVDKLEFPRALDLLAALETILQAEGFHHPIVGVIPPESVRDWREAGENNAAAAEERLARGIASFQSANPYAYPQLFSFTEIDHGAHAETWLWKTRLDDVLALGAALRSTELPFYGLVSGKCAVGEILRLVLAGISAPATIVDVGKLRTLYIGGKNGRITFEHAIPVGMLRDDQHYFPSVPANMDRVVALKDELGSLLFPADVTPSPLFEPSLTTPQLDCTRFATQVARYAHRVVHDVWTQSGESESVRYFLGGSASRLPGLRDYLQFKAQLKLETITGDIISGLSLANGVTWQDVGTHLAAIGAAIAFHRRTQSRFGLVLRDQRPIPISRPRIDFSELKEERVYLQEHPILTKRHRR